VLIGVIVAASNVRFFQFVAAPPEQLPRSKVSRGDPQRTLLKPGFFCFAFLFN
jgi:hypothetical protein